MTPKEKAEELYNKYEQLGKDFTRGVSMAEFAKQCALIAVGEILSMGIMSDSGDWKMAKLYWQEVKQEIQKL
jgi:hypothetical protein